MRTPTALPIPSPSVYRAVFFDAGETLLHPLPSFPELFARVLADSGHRVAPDAVTEAASGVSVRFEEAATTGETWSTSPERSRRFWFSIYEGMLGSLAVPDGSELRGRLYATFSDPTSYGLFPEVAAVMAELHRRGHVLGVISNFEAWLDLLLELLGLGEFLSVRAISGIEGVEKPDPALFQLALERGGIAPSECLYVGDSPRFDVEPAARVGMTPVLIDRSDRHGSFAGIRISSMSQLMEVLEP